MHCMMSASAAVNTQVLCGPFMLHAYIHIHSFIHAAFMYINDALDIFVFNCDSPLVISDWLLQTRLQSL